MKTDFNPGSRAADVRRELPAGKATQSTSDQRRRAGASGTPNRHSGLAFTIIEVMLAIGVFALVLTAIYATWIAILKGSKSALKAAAEVQRSRIAMRTLEDAFNSTEMFVANMNYYLFLADTSGDMASVSLASRLPAGFPGVGRYGDQIVRRVSFYTQPGKDGMSDLIMTQAPILLVTNNEVQGYTITLARDVTMFRMFFYDDRKNEWLDEWNKTNQLPRLVQIALGLGKSAGDPGKPYDLTTSLVALPSVAVQPDIQNGQAPFPPGQGGTNRTGLRGTQFDPNNPNQFQNPNQNPYQNPGQNPYQNPNLKSFPNPGQDPRFNRGTLGR